MGAVVVAEGGTVLGEGYSRREDLHDHAEEVALRTEAALDAERRQALATALAALVPDDAALAQAEASGFDEELKARWIAARDDLPRRLQELGAAR